MLTVGAVDTNQMAQGRNTSAEIFDLLAKAAVIEKPGGFGVVEKFHVGIGCIAKVDRNPGGPGAQNTQHAEQNRDRITEYMSKQTKPWPTVLSERLEPWQPSADVHRTQDGWLVKFDLAGVQVADVMVAIRGRRLIVSGVRRDSFLEEGSSYYSMEISYNRFERSLMMPANLESARVTIVAREGLLLVRLITEGNENV